MTEEAIRQTDTGSLNQDVADEEVFAFPTSFAQQRLWFLDQFEPNSPFYNMPAAVRLQGELDVDVLADTFREIIQRHETLRTTFAAQNGEPVQVIAPRAEFALPQIDLSNLAPQERETEALRLANQEARKPFNLSVGPLMRARLLRLDDEDHVLLLTMHHIISDGWSIGVLVREIATIYAALAHGATSPLPELAIQYADFAVWQREWLQGEVLDGQMEYWRQKLGGSLPVLELPTDMPRPAVQSSRGDTLSRRIPRALTDRLLALGREENATLFMVLLAAFQTLLYRYSGQEDICIGTPIANRNRREIEDLIGMFINTLLIRTDLSGEPTFQELLQQVRADALEAYAHQDLPFEMLVEELQPERDMSHTPLFQVMLILQNASTGSHELPGLRVSMMETHSGTSTFDLTLSVTDTPDGLDASIEYSTDLFHRETIERFLGCFETLLASIVEDPTCPISQLQIITDPEQRRILVDWNDAALAYPTDLCIHQLIEQQAEERPDAVAVIYQGESLTYGELNRRASQLAHYLQRCGLEREGRVGLFMERSLDALVGLLGILKAGGAYVPLDPTYPSDRLAYMLDDAGIALLLTQEHLCNLLPDHQGEIILLDGDWAAIAEEADALSSRHADPDALAYVIYTSGSTGQPKGVMVTHSSLVNAAFAWRQSYGLDEPGIRHLQMASLSFDVFTGDMVRALCWGGALVLCPREILLEAPELYALLKDERVDCAEFVPAVLRNLVQHLEGSGDRLDFMRLVICGSDAWYAGEYARFLALCGPDTRLINSFGLTEATIDTTYFETRTLDVSDDLPVPIGRPFANMQCYILGPHHNLVPVGVPGELYVGGRGLARGYLNLPKLTAERFVTVPSVGGQRLYRTGDLARYLPDGNIQFLGRIDDQVKVRGYRIELGEIEAVLAQHPMLSAAAAAVRSDGRGSTQLVAYTVPADGQSPDSGELRRFVQQRLPDYMVPSLFMQIDSLPLSPSGKINRQALPEPDWSQRTSAETFQPPRTETERLLADIWSEVLGLEQVGVLDNFFELGGHSLLATQLASRVRARLDVDLPLRRIFEAPTIGELAEWIEIAQRSAHGIEEPPIERVPRDGDLPLSFAQQRLWFLAQLEPDSPFYNMSDAVAVNGPLDLAVLHRVMQAIVHRHESLRTNFVTVDGRPVQRIHAELTIDLPIVDLKHLSPDEQQVEVERRLQQEATQPFDLAKDPLLRVVVLRLAKSEHVILLTVHHIISDNWSSTVLMQEITTLYDAFVQDAPSPLPELPIQYADFAAWQRGWLQGEVRQKMLDYWREQLTGAPPLLELPTDRPRPPVQTFNGAYHEFMLSAELTRALQALNQREGTTLFMTLMAAFQTLLHRYSGQDDISVGTVIANRNRADIEQLIGFFVNALVIRSRLEPGLTFRGLLQRVREAALGAYAHQDLPFEALVDALQPQRDMSHSPLFQVMLVLQNVPQGYSSGGMAGLDFQPLSMHSGTAKFDLTLFATQIGDCLGGAIEYNTDLFDAATITRMEGHFERLLESIVEDPDVAIETLPILTESERQQLLVEWNETATPFPDQTAVHRLFEQQTAADPQAIALRFQGASMTYDELNRRANQLARVLGEAGVAPGALVGLCLERSFDMIVALLGILKAGGAYLPLDVDYPRERLAYMLADSQAPVLVTHSALLERLPVDGVTTVCVDRDADRIAAQNDDNLDLAVGPEDLAYIIYTSGSTGQPKGVLLAHVGVCSLMGVLARALDITPATRMLQVSTLSFDASVIEILGTLTNGGRLCLTQRDTLLSPGKLAELVKREGMTTLFMPPSLLTLLDPEAFAAVETIAVGGEACPPEMARRWAPGRPFINAYGPTEVTVMASLYRVESVSPGAISIPIGGPIANTQVYVLDGQMQPVPIGVPGELYVSGVGLARGYLNRPELTAERFVPNPFSDEPDARMYKTGDLVRWLGDGALDFLGRIDHQVKIRGFRVELGEIEAALTAHLDVAAAVVLLREDEPGDKRLVAYLQPEEKATLDLVAIRRQLEKALPDYMVPHGWVVLDRLPLTPSSKIDRSALPAPDVESLGLTGEYEAPRSESEHILVEIWKELLGVERVGVTDSFFDLGGHSLLAIRLLARIRQVWGIDVPVRSVFEHSTVAELAREINAALRGSTGADIPAIVPVEQEGPLPLSYGQQRLWFLDQLAPGNLFYTIPMAVKLSGALDVNALRRALQEIVQRHEVLRTTFVNIDGTPMQVIAPTIEIDMPLIDLMDVAEEGRDAKIERLIRAEVQQPFDLSQGPLLRGRLLRLDEQEHVVVLVIHHIVTDGWSQEIFLSELGTLYAAFSQGQLSPLEDLPIQYSDYAQWQRSWLTGDELEKQLTYWREQLGQHPPMLELPTDRPRPPVQTFNGAYHEFMLSEELTSALQALNQREGTTLFMTLMAAFQTLLHRYSGQDDISVGTVIANRSRTDIERLIGFFVNTLVIRSRLEPGLTFRGLLQRVREAALGAYAHQDLPFEALVDALQPQRDLSHSPLFQVMLVLQNVPQGHNTGGNAALDLQPLSMHSGTANFDMTLSMSQTGNRLGGTIEYNTDLFDAATIARMSGHFERLLEAVVEDPDVAIETLPILTGSERQQLLVEWNATDAPFPDQTAVHHLFEQQAAADSQAIALRFQGSSMTYDQLNRRANQLARVLGEAGVVPGTLVGLCLERSFDMIVALLGILKAGGAYLPLDVDYPRERLAYMLADSQAPVLVTHSALLERLPVNGVTVVCVDRDAERIAAQDDGNLDLSVGPEDLAYVIYTSGSTGQPKGVPLAHRGVCNLMGVVADVFDITAATRMLQFSSLSFDASAVEILGTLTNGGRLCMAQRETLLSPGELVELVKDEEITILQMPPSLLALLDPEAFKTVETVASVGEACPPQLARQWSGRYRFLNGYGPTETTVATSICAIDDLPADAPRVPIGRPIANTHVYVLDGQMQPVPVGVSGELYVSGAGLALGYLNRPELTAERFVPNPFGEEPGARMYKTGDLVRWLEDGTLDFLGRIDHQVKIRGFRVELGEIEAALMSPHDVAAAVVLLREDEPGDKRLVAYLQPEEKANLDLASIRRQLEKVLPDYMVPQGWIVLDRLPLMPNGKVDRNALPAPDGYDAVVVADYVAARDALEVQLAQIWEDVLGMERVGVTDSFFDLGGHSLLAVRVMAKIQERLGETLSLADFFRAPTVEQLAMAIREQKGALASLLVPLREGNGRRPLFFVHPSGGSVHWYADLARHLHKEQPFYGIQAQGLDGKASLDIHIEDMAARYINAIKTVQPEGPYLLGSWSLGVIIAYEMARQLEQQNEQVAFLGLLDQGPVLPLPVAHSQAEYLVDTFGQYVPVTLADLEPLTDEEQLEYLFTEAKRVRFLMPDVTLEQFTHFAHILRTQSEAWRNYQVQPYSGRITLFRARKRPKWEHNAAPDLGWGALARGGVEIYQVPGDHLQIVHEPWVRLLVRRLTSCLKDVS